MPACTCPGHGETQRISSAEVAAWGQGFNAGATPAAIASATAASPPAGGRSPGHRAFNAAEEGPRGPRSTRKLRRCHKDIKPIYCTALHKQNLVHFVSIFMGKCSCWGVQDIGDKVAVEGQLVAVATGLVVGPSLPRASMLRMRKPSCRRFGAQLNTSPC